MSRINRLSASPVASAIMGVLLVAAVVYVFLHEQAFGWLPSTFESALNDKSYGYWHRWVHLTPAETFVAGSAVYIAWYLVSQTYDPIYRFVRKYPWAPLLLPAAYLLLLVGRDLYTGYAVYEDRIALRSPLSGQQIREYRASDIVSVEIGCHFRGVRRLSVAKWAVPTYTITFRDGTTLSPFDLADADFRNPHLMTAVLRFDKQVEAAGVEKIYWLTSGGREVNNGNCFDHMEGYFHPSFRPAMRRTFLPGGTND